jgi:hypothetical protein
MRGTTHGERKDRTPAPNAASRPREVKVMFVVLPHHSHTQKQPA